MIKSLSVNHYKAFNEASVEFKPITILLGSNNIGKTSLMQLLLVLQNTRNVDQLKYKSALRLHGSYVSLGQNENIFRNKDTNQDVKIGFSLNYKDINNSFYNEVINPLDELMERLFWELERYYFFLRKEKARKTKSDNSISYEKDRPELLKDDITIYLEKIKSLKEIWKRIGDQKISRKDFIRLSAFRDAEDFLIIDNTEFERVHIFANSFRKLKQNEIRIEYSIGYENGEIEEDSNLVLNAVEIFSGDLSFIKLDLKTKEISSSVIQESFLASNYKSSLLSRIDLEGSIFEFLDNKTINRWPYLSKRRTLSLELVLRFINILVSDLKKHFNEDAINHVSPLRASPKRYYYVDRAQMHNVLDTSDADSITDVIRENRNNVVDKANKWLENFNINIEAKTFKELIHTLRVTNKKEQLALDLTDVGFGISQVLPIILQGFLSGESTTTLIEQPEIHLHPRMQGDLADLFIEIVTDEELDFEEFRKEYPTRNNNKSIIIETHSEYLLYRLRRRISQRLISPEDVGLYFFEKTSENSTVIRRIPIMQEGTFEWPSGFSTAMEDTTAFMKNSRVIKKENK